MFGLVFSWPLEFPADSKFPGVWRVLNPTVFRIPKIWRFFSICPEIRNEFFKPSYVVGHFWGFAFRNVWNDLLVKVEIPPRFSHPILGFRQVHGLLNAFETLGGRKAGTFRMSEEEEGMSNWSDKLIGRFVLIQQLPEKHQSVFCSFEELLGFWGVVSCSVLTWRDIYLFKLLSWTRHTEGRTSCVEFPYTSLSVKDLQAKGIPTGFLLLIFFPCFSGTWGWYSQHRARGAQGCGGFIKYGRSKKARWIPCKWKWVNGSTWGNPKNPEFSFEKPIQDFMVH